MPTSRSPSLKTLRAMRPLPLLLFSIAALSLAGCGVGSVVGGGGSNKVFTARAAQLPGNSVLYLYRPEASNPGPNKPLRLSYPEIFIDGNSVGALPYNRHLAIELAPGAHKIRVTGLTEQARGWESRDIERTLRITSADTHFMRLRVEYNLKEMNIMQPQAQYLIFLTPVDAQDAIYEIRHTDPADS